jgi:hypothetical protein
MQSKHPRKGLRALLRELSDDDNNVPDTGLNDLEDPDQPWLPPFRAYMDVIEHVPDGWSTVKWWGVSVPRTDT